MKKQIVTTLLLAGAMLALFSCTKSPSSSSSSTGSGATFNGSFFQISYNGNSYDAKDSAIGSVHYSAITASNTSTAITIIVASTPGNYGLTEANLTFIGTGTGTYTLANVSQGEGLIDQYTPTILPLVDTGGGSATITHNGTDYTAGTFTTTLYTSGYGLSYPATGSFKVVY